MACAGVRGVRREPLRRLIDEPGYGAEEIRREGFTGRSELGNLEFANSEMINRGFWQLCSHQRRPTRGSA
jgi:hypothetical protein